MVKVIRASVSSALLSHLMRKSVGLPQGQLLIVEGVPEYTAHHGNVLREEEEEKSDRTFTASPREAGETQARD